MEALKSQGLRLEAASPRGWVQRVPLAASAPLSALEAVLQALIATASACRECWCKLPEVARLVPGYWPPLPSRQRRTAVVKQLADRRAPVWPSLAGIPPLLEVQRTPCRLWQKPHCLAPNWPPLRRGPTRPIRRNRTSRPLAKYLASK